MEARERRLALLAEEDAAAAAAEQAAATNTAASSDIDMAQATTAAPGAVHISVTAGFSWLPVMTWPGLLCPSHTYLTALLSLVSVARTPSLGPLQSSAVQDLSCHTAL